MKQQEEFFELDFVKMRRWFPVLHLLRVPGMALDWRKLILAALATLLVAKCISSFGLVGNDIQLGADPSDLSRSQTITLNTLSNAHSRFSFITLPDRGSMDVLRPMSDLFVSFNSFLSAQNSDWNQFLFHLSGCLLVYLIWSFAGIASCRTASNEFVSGMRGSFSNSLSLGGRGLKAAFFFLFLISILLGILWCVNAAWGYLVSMVFGSTFGLYTGFIPTLVSLAMFVLLLGMTLGWPMMVASISADGSDGFDALSRTYNYVLSRFLSFLFYAFVLLFLGRIFINLVYVAGGTIVSILASTTSTWVDKTGTLNASLFGWNEAVRALTVSYGISFFWSGMTVIYFLLRKAEDGTPLDEMYFHRQKEDAAGVPLVGIAERQQIEKEKDI